MTRSKQSTSGSTEQDKASVANVKHSTLSQKKLKVHTKRFMVGAAISCYDCYTSSLEINLFKRSLHTIHVPRYKKVD